MLPHLKERTVYLLPHTRAQGDPRLAGVRQSEHFPAVKLNMNEKKSDFFTLKRMNLS